ncbi:hypothetical protein ACQR0Z_22905 [Bradyrhizobium sp. HKCCYLS3077]|uniref:hypothetical protein n=1 Tax=Bradyrhizobium sp. HKCCYLS3077 TaxID=3420761 RepID=UPI003EB7DD96
MNTKQDASTDRVRMTIDLSRRLNEKIEQIAKEKGASKADVMRLAIEFLEAGIKAKEDGLSVGGWGTDDKGNRHEREFVGW